MGKRPTSFHSPEKAKKIKAAWEKEINTDETGKQLPPVKATAASLKDFKKRMKKANPDGTSRAAGAPDEECSWLEENWEWVVIIGASVLAVVVIIVIACCCCKSAKRPVPLAAVSVMPGGLSQMPSGVGPTVAWQPVSRTPSGMPRMSGSASSRRPSGFSGFWPGQSRTYSIALVSPSHSHSIKIQCNQSLSYLLSQRARSLAHQIEPQERKQ